MLTDFVDVYLRPVAVFPDPFRLHDNILVLTECWNADGTPNKFNYRHEVCLTESQYMEYF